MQSQINLLGLMKDINELEFWIDGSGAEMSVKPAEYPNYLKNKSFIRQAIAEIERLTNQKSVYVMINKLKAGVEVSVHTDTLPKRIDRYHLPILTNEKAFWWDRVYGVRHLKAGVWYGPMPYWLDHSVANFGDIERVHLVVDLE